MKKWQEKCNYRRVKDSGGTVTAYLIMVDGTDVEVSKEVYLAYASADRRERYVEEEVEADKKLSLDKLEEDSVPLEALGVRTVPSAEESVLYIADAQERETQKARLSAALSGLEDSERLLLQAMFFDGLSTREYARRTGVTQHAVIKRRDRILRDIKKFFNNFSD